MLYEEDIHIYKSFVNKQMGISMSIPDTADIEYEEGHRRILEQKREIVRYLQYAGLTIGYGGDFRSQEAGGITSSMINQLSENKQNRFRQRDLLVNYVAWPLSIFITPTDFQEVSGKLKVKLVNMPEELITDVDPMVFIPPDNINHQYCWARSLSSMRRQMARHMDGRMALYGKKDGYKGFHSGVVEEVYWTLKHNKPVYLLGSFGGVTKDIIAALRGEVPENLTEEYQRQDYQRANLLDYARIKLGRDFVGPNKILSFFHKKGLKALKNGLNTEENEHLIESNHVSEMITLIIKGLTYIYG